MSKIVLFPSLFLFSVPSPFSAKWTRSPHITSLEFFMVFSQGLLLDYGSLQRLSLFLSCSALPLSYSLHCLFLFASKPLFRTSPAFLFVSVFVLVRKIEKNELMFLSNVLFWLGSASCVTLIWATISGDRLVFHLNKPVS